jgi:outer membrane receptor protein involved in Fe transport
MNLTTQGVRNSGVGLTNLLGTASVLTIASAVVVQDRAQAAQSEEIPENVLITGSLIRGTVAVGVPVVNLSPMDFANTGALTTADLFKNFPAANVATGEAATESGARVERGAKVNIRGLDSGTAVRALMMIDGVRFPPQSNGLCAIDPSIIPSISLDRIDILVDGASATYGSDAISGVINLILRRNFDGAMTQVRFTDRVGGGNRWQVGGLWGRTWDGGQITLSYEWYEESPSKGNAISKFGMDHSPWGFDDRRGIGSSSPAIVSTASTGNALGTACGFNTGASPQTNSTCYSLPQGIGQNFQEGSLGPTAPFSASTVNWQSINNNSNFAGPLNPSAGTRNMYDPYTRVWYDAVQARNGGAITVDQRLTEDISAFFTGFYSNRRSKFLIPTNQGPGANNALTNITVPSFNPYYPTGGAPNNLRVAYDIGREAPAQVDAYEVAARYHMGLNIALPAEWQAQVYYSETYDSSYNHVSRSVNKNAVSAALGWTMAAQPASGTGPAIGTWTKPGFIPYLNLFCDPSQFQCNSAQTLNYVSGYRALNEKFWINEKGIRADGPLFDLPGGTVKAAIGMNLTSMRFNYTAQDNTSTANTLINPLYDAQGRFIWATFAQVNIPLIGENNALPLIRRFDFEASWRHDQYSDVLGTSNPKIAFNYSPFEDLTFKGAWGTNFRAPNFGEISALANTAIVGWNVGSLASNTAPIAACAVNGALPDPASGAGKLQHAAFNFNNQMAAAGIAGYSTLSAATGCVGSLNIPDPSLDGSTVTVFNTPGDPSSGVFRTFSSFADPGVTASPAGGLIAPLNIPGGISHNGGQGAVLDLRRETLSQNGLLLKPENAVNWGIGFDYSPTNFLRGLNIQATYYIVKITGVLRGFGNPNDTRFQNGQLPFAYPAPSDMGCPDLYNAAAPSIPIPANLVPSACPGFMRSVASLMANPRAAVDVAAQTITYFINDGGIFNQGWQKLQGIDWNWSYDWDMGNIGAFNIGAIGTYYLTMKSETMPGAAGSVIEDGFNTIAGSTNALSRGVSTLPRLRYRGRLGWSNGPWNVTGFVDYQSHYYHTQGAPPNVNGNFCTSTAFGAQAGGTFPCFNSAYNNIQPPWYSFDLSFGYDTGDVPSNPYLKNIGIQVIIQNIFDKKSQYQYRTQTQGGQPCTCNPLQGLYGRQVSLIVSKTW